MKDDNFFLAILIGVVSGLIVAFSQIVSTCVEDKCTPEVIAIKMGILIVMSFLLFIIFVIAFKRIAKQKGKIP